MNAFQERTKKDNGELLCHSVTTLIIDWQPWHSLLRDQPVSNTHCSRNPTQTRSARCHANNVHAPICNAVNSGQPNPNPQRARRSTVPRCRRPSPKSGPATAPFRAMDVAARCTSVTSNSPNVATPRRRCAGFHCTLDTR